MKMSLYTVTSSLASLAALSLLYIEGAEAVSVNSLSQISALDAPSPKWQDPLDQGSVMAQTTGSSHLRNHLGNHKHDHKDKNNSDDQEDEDGGNAIVWAIVIGVAFICCIVVLCLLHRRQWQ